MDTGITLSNTEVIGAVGSLVAFILALIGVIHQHMKENKSDLNEMRKEKDDLVMKVIDLTSSVSKMEGERKGFQEGVEKISAEVISEVRRLKND